MRRLLLPALALALGACSGGPSGEGGTCVSNRDCGSGFVCISGACLGGGAPACGSDLDCPLGEVCDVESGKCGVEVVTACAADVDCPADQRCNTLTGVCIDAPRSCAEGQPCPEGRYCATDTNTCVICLEDTHCPGEDVCRERMCVDRDKPPEPGGCTEDSSCNPPQSICLEGMCSLGCGNPGGLMCDPEAVCDTSTGRCVVIEGPCTSDPDCSPPMTVCESGQCIPGCGQIGGVQCSGGQQCNPNSGRCQAGGDICLSDDDCNSPSEICDLFSGVCSPGCGTTGCTAPETCNAATGHCEGNTPCTADRFEPNQSAAAAAQINGGAQSGLSICPGDEDYFAVSLGSGDAVEITVSFVHGDGNLELELRDPSGQVVATSAGTTGSETITYNAAAAGVHVARVWSSRDTGPTPGNTYTLQIRAMVAPCPDDPFEDNDSDGNAALLLPGNRNNLNVCLGDEDFYDVILAGGETLTVDLGFSHAEGDIDAQILGLLGIPLATAASSTDNETVSYTANNFGFFTIRVSLTADSGSMPGNPYSMDVSVGAAPPPPPPPGCANDAYENNDSASAATALTPGNQSNLNVCTGDDDFYAYNFAAGDDVTVNVSFSDAEGDIDVALLNAAGTAVADGTTSTDDESFSYTVTTAGTYTLRVYLYGDAGSTPGNPYSMNVQVAGSVTCAPDPFEPNNSRTAATPVPAGTYSGLTSCENDADHYAINLTSGQAVSVQTLFSHAEGDVDIRLFDPAGVQRASSLSNTDDENINYTPTQSGTFTVEASLYRDLGTTPGNAYQLIVGP